MFFIAGISPITKEIRFHGAPMVCGRYGNYQVFMTCMCLSLFFIPILKWNRRYYVKTTCCETVYELREETGKILARGGDAEIRPEDLTLLQDGHALPAWETELKRCPSCGFETKEDFLYGPKCGEKLR